VKIIPAKRNLNHDSSAEQYFVGTATTTSAGDHGTLEFWYDFDDRSTLWQQTDATVPVFEEGDPIRLVQDKSGNNLDLTPLSNRLPPEYGLFSGAQNGAIFSGYHALEGSNSGTPWGFLSDGSEYTLILRARQTNITTGFHGFISTKNFATVGQAGINLSFQASGDVLSISVENTESSKDPGNDVWVGSSAGFTEETSVTLTFQVNGTDYIARKNGSVLVTIAQDESPSVVYHHAMTVGVMADNGANPLRGVIYRMWCYNSALTGSTLTDAEAAIAV